MDTDKYKSIAISMPVYLKLKELAEKKFDAPVSMAKIVEMEINKSYDEDFPKVLMSIDHKIEHIRKVKRAEYGELRP